MKIERPKRNIEHSNRNLSQILCGGNGQGGLHAQLKLKRQAWKSLLLNSNYSSCLTLISPPTVQWISAFVLFITVCDLCSSCTPCSVDARAQVHDGSFLTKCLLLMAVLSLSAAQHLALRRLPCRRRGRVWLQTLRRAAVPKTLRKTRCTHTDKEKK